MPALEWTPIKAGYYASGAYRLIKVDNTHTHRYVWIVQFEGAQIGVQPTLVDAKQVAEAHVEGSIDA